MKYLNNAIDCLKGVLTALWVCRKDVAIILGGFSLLFLAILVRLIPTIVVVLLGYAALVYLGVL